MHIAEEDFRYVCRKAFLNFTKENLMQSTNSDETKPSRFSKWKPKGC